MQLHICFELDLLPHRWCSRKMGASLRMRKLHSCDTGREVRFDRIRGYATLTKSAKSAKSAKSSSLFPFIPWLFHLFGTTGITNAYWCSTWSCDQETQSANPWCRKWEVGGGWTGEIGGKKNTNLGRPIPSHSAKSAKISSFFHLFSLVPPQKHWHLWHFWSVAYPLLQAKFLFISMGVFLGLKGDYHFVFQNKEFLLRVVIIAWVRSLAVSDSSTWNSKTKIYGGI